MTNRAQLCSSSLSGLAQTHQLRARTKGNLITTFFVFFIRPVAHLSVRHQESTAKHTLREGRLLDISSRTPFQDTATPEKHLGSNTSFLKKKASTFHIFKGGGKTSQNKNSSILRKRSNYKISHITKAFCLNTYAKQELIVLRHFHKTWMLWQ